MKTWALVGLLLIGTASVSRAQPCRGDIDNDGQVTTADAVALVPLLFQEVELSPATAARADANDDGILSAADIIAILQLDGWPCPTLSGTPTRTAGTPGGRSPTPTPTGHTLGPTPTFTATRTVTATRRATPIVTFTWTQGPTPTPTTVCTVTAAQFGTMAGELTANDCTRTVQGVLRHVNVYSIVGAPGEAIEIEVVAGSAAQPLERRRTPTAAATPTATPVVTSPFFLTLIDPAGQFESVAGAPPIQFVVTTSQPYEFMVATDVTVAEQLPTSYTLRVTSVPCPTPVVLPFPNTTSQSGTLGSQCPDLGVPAIGNVPNPADVYTFTISQVPANVSITMKQNFCGDPLNPMVTVLGPDGFELLTQDNDNLPGGPSGIGGTCGGDELVRFLALEPGTYTVLAKGGTGGYHLTLQSPTCTPTALANIPSDSPLTCPGQTGPGCQGTLYGNTTKTSCAAPLPVLNSYSPNVPDIGSPADLYTFTASAGDVISVEMNSDDDAHLFLIGPDTAGNPLVAEDDDSSPVGASNAQLAATLTLPGTYTIVAANNNMLAPPIPTQMDPGDSVNYTLLVQKCPVSGFLDINSGTPVSSAFNVSDCFGFGSVPFRTYSFNGTAGQFVSATMKSTTLDASLRIFAPDGSQVANDDDQFVPLTTNARANRILPQTGTYFVEVSTSLDAGGVDVTTRPSGYTVQAKSCATTPVTSGPITGTFTDNDCQLDSGQKFDVYTYSANGAPTPRALSLLPPANSCVVALMAEGCTQVSSTTATACGQLPEDLCSTTLLELPVVSGGTYGFMIAANDASTRGSHTAPFSSCPVNMIGFGDQRAGTLPGGCAAADGALADWYLFRAPEPLVDFSDGSVSGQVTATFPLAGLLSDAFGGVPLTPDFSDDSGSMVPLGGDRGLLLHVNGATASNHGNYTLNINPARLRQ